MAIEQLEDISIIEKIVAVLGYFATLRHSVRVSLFGGLCRGRLFPRD